MIHTIRELFRLAARSKALWLLPVVLGLVIAALLVAGAATSPVPLFIYPLL